MENKTNEYFDNTELHKFINEINEAIDNRVLYVSLVLKAIEWIKKLESELLSQNEKHKNELSQQKDMFEHKIKDLCSDLEYQQKVVQFLRKKLNA